MLNCAKPGMPCMSQDDTRVRMVIQEDLKILNQQLRSEVG